MLGILIGRGTTPAPVDVATPTVETAPVAGENLAQRLHTRDVLLRTETLLADFRQAAAAPEAEFGAPHRDWASGLLFETRRLIDDSTVDAPELTRLFRDLELILAEIVQLADEADPRERDEIRRSLEDRGLMLRLRNAVPAKPGTRGA